jgi:hypothetical protein
VRGEQHNGTSGLLEFLLQGGFIACPASLGKLEGQRIVTGQKWEEVKKGGDDAVKRWIKAEMSGRTCLVVLAGSNTASRPWVKYEIKKAWNDKLGVVGIRIHGLTEFQTASARGANPFDGMPFVNIVTLYDPPGRNGKEVYGSISNSLERLVEDAIKIRAKYS